SLVPDVIFFLTADPELLLHRVFAKYGQLDYWESGMDLGASADMLESFRKYQTALREHFHQLAGRYGFELIDASPDPQTIQEQIRQKVGAYLGGIARVRRQP